MTNINLFVEQGTLKETLWGCGDKANNFLVMKLELNADNSPVAKFLKAGLNVQCKGIG